MEKSTKIKPSCEYHCEFEDNQSISISSKILVKIPAVLRKLCPCTLLPHVPYCPCAPPPRCLTSMCNINHPFTHVPHCPCVKMMSSCQKDVKLSKRCQMSENQTHRLWRRFTKKINWHNEVHTHWRQFLTSHMMVTKTLKMCIESVFEGFWWPSYVTSKIDGNVCEPHYVNLFFLWTSSIVYVFDFLTFDIFLRIWHLFDNLTSFWLFLGGLSLHLNHLIGSRVRISFRSFGTLPIGIFFSNLDSRQLMTCPRTLSGQIWNMLLFGDSRAVRVLMPKYRGLRKSFFFSMKERQLFLEAWGF